MLMLQIYVKRLANALCLLLLLVAALVSYRLVGVKEGRKGTENWLVRPARPLFVSSGGSRSIFFNYLSTGRTTDVRGGLVESGAS